MRVSKRFLLVLAISTGVIIIVVILSIVFLVKEKVNVIDNTKYFSISRQSSPLFTSYLNEWKIWEKNSVSLDNKTKHTIKTILLIFTDTPQQHFRMGSSLPGTNSTPYATYNWDVSKKGALIITIQMDPTYYESYTQRQLEFGVTRIVTRALYDATHRAEIETQQNEASLTKILNTFRSQNNLPFTVTYQK